jgi:hypothetical protein
MIKPYNTDFKTLNNEGQNEINLLDPYPDNDNTPPSFPIDALPAGISDYIHVLATGNNSPDFLAAAGLFTTSVAVGNTHKIIISDADIDKDPLNGSLFAIIVGRSASGKTPAIKAMIKPLDKMNNAALQAWKDNGEPDDGEPIPLFVHKLTFEALLSTLSKAIGGLGMHTDEIITLVENANKYRKGGDLTELMQLLDGETTSIRCATKKTKFINDPFLSIIGGAQPAVLSDLFNPKRTENGFLNRVGLFFGGASIPDPDVEIDAETKEANRRALNLAKDKYTETIINLLSQRSPDLNFWRLSASGEKVHKDLKRKIYQIQDDPKKQTEFETRMKNLLIFYKLSLLTEIFTQLSETGCITPDLISGDACERAKVMAEYTVETALFTRRILAAGAANIITKPAPRAKDCRELKLYDALPAEFTTKQALTAGGDLGLSSATVDRYIRNNTVLYKDEGHGKYSKISTENIN